jgi:hypothetical protein
MSPLGFAVFVASCARFGNSSVVYAGPVSPGAATPPVPVNVTALTAPIAGVGSGEAVIAWAMPPDRYLQLQRAP